MSNAIRQVIRQATGNQAFSGDLPSGYLIYIPKARDIAASVRASREAPPIRVWLAGADAIQRAAFQVDFT